MVDHRRTPSRRAYHLPGWFFALTALACVAALTATAWTITRNGSTLPTPAISPAPTSTAEPASQEPHRPAQPEPEERPSIEVEVLNASGTPGLAAETAEVAEKAGWTIGSVGNWQYGASHEAVYFPEGQQEAAELLADDLKIGSVEPAKTGMKINQLTVIVLGQ